MSTRLRWRLAVAHLLIWMHRWMTRIGRRGAALLIVGPVFILRGLSYHFDPPFPTKTETANYEILLRFFPWEAWAVIWVSVGIVSMFQAFNPSRDRMAFTLLQGISFAWVGGLAIGWLEKGGLRWIGVLSWTLVACLLQVIAGWPETYSMRERRRIWR